MQIKKRNPLFSAILSLFFPGLGQFYNGQLKKGFVFFLLPILILMFFGFTRSLTHYPGLIAFITIEMAFRLYACIDAYIVSRRLRSYTLSKINSWYFYVLFIIINVTISIFMDVPTLSGIITLKVPTTSNYPTIHVGDLVVCDNTIYNSVDPDYGDFVAFRSDLDGEIYTYRLIGLPGDSLEIVDHFVLINGKKCTTEFLGNSHFDNKKVLGYLEVLPNGHRHKFYKFQNPIDSLVANLDSIIVPIDMYFLLGDNRDNARDSRYIGFVRKDQILGKVLYSYWGESKARINVNYENN